MTADQPMESTVLEAPEAVTARAPTAPEDPRIVDSDSAASAAPATEEPAQEPSDTAAPSVIEEPSPTLKDLRPGMQLAGCVVNVTRLGAFVDVGVGRDGLLHTSEIQKAGRSAEIKRGDEIQVWVLNADQKANRLSLSLDQRTTLRKLTPGMSLKGRIVRLTKFGAFVDVGAVVDGLVHSDEIRRAGEEGKLEPGQEVEVFVRSVNRKSRRLGLGLGRRTPLADIKPGDELDGRIMRLAAFGAFVDIGAEIDGLIHVSELPGGGTPADVLSVGEETRVRVQSVDRERRRIGLSMKRISRMDYHDATEETQHFPTAMEIALLEAQERANRKK